MSALPRHRCPVVFVAYGEGGEAWLSAAARRCADDPVLRKLVEHRIVQFWWVGDRGATEPIHALGTSPDAERLAHLLGEARRVQWTTAYPDLRVSEVLVLERLSLFETGGAARHALTAAMDRASRVNLDPQAEPEFSFRWIALADVLRSASRPTPHAVQCALEVLDAEPTGSLTFLVDRVNSVAAQIDADYANAALQRLAFGFMTGDLGAPRADGGQPQIPSLLTTPQPGHVVPFDVLELEHPWRLIEEARARALRDRVALGIPDLRHAHTLLGRSDGLRHDLQRDLAEAGRPTFDAHAARVRRRKCAETLLAWAFAEGRSTEARSVLQHCTRELPRFAIRADGAVTAPRSSIGTLLLAADGIAHPHLLGGVALVVASIAITLAWQRWRARQHGSDSTQPHDPGASMDSPTDAEQRADVQREWESLCARLEDLLTEWERICAGTQRNGDESSVPLWCARPPFVWTLSDELRVDDAGFPISAELCQQLAKEAVAALEREQRGAPAALGAACRAVLRSLTPRGGARAGAQIATALEQRHAQALRCAFAKQGFLAQSAPPPTLHSVIWLTGPELELDHALTQLEPPQTLSATTILSHDATTQSIRFAFAAPVPWRRITSLSSLFDPAVVQAGASE